MKDWLKPRTIFATLFYVSFLWLIVVEHANPPDYLGQIVAMLMGYYFGSRTAKNGGAK